VATKRMPIREDQLHNWDLLKAVPLHENLGEDYRDNPGEVVSGYRDKQGAD
jgi:hypothetical protein